MKTTFFDEFVKSAKEAPKIYFAPVIGAMKAVQAEFRRINTKPMPAAKGQKKIDS